MTRLLLIALALAVAQGRARAETPAPESLTLEEMKQAKDLFKEYFEAKTWEDKRKVAEKLSGLDHPSRSDIAKLAQHCFALAKDGPKIANNKGEQKCTDPDYPGTYLLTLPAGAKQGKPTGVFISLHGGGKGSGSGSEIMGLFGCPGQGLINVYPTVIQKVDDAWNTEREEQYVLAILEDLKRSFITALRDDLRHTVLQSGTFYGHLMDHYRERLKSQRTEPWLYSILDHRYCSGK